LNKTLLGHSLGPFLGVWACDLPILQPALFEQVGPVS